MRKISCIRLIFCDFRDNAGVCVHIDVIAIVSDRRCICCTGKTWQAVFTGNDGYSKYRRNWFSTLRQNGAQQMHGHSHCRHTLVFLSHKSPTNRLWLLHSSVVVCRVECLLTGICWTRNGHDVDAALSSPSRSDVPSKQDQVQCASGRISNLDAARSHSQPFFAPSNGNPCAIRECMPLGCFSIVHVTSLKIWQN